MNEDSGYVFKSENNSPLYFGASHLASLGSLNSGYLVQKLCSPQPKIFNL